MKTGPTYHMIDPSEDDIYSLIKRHQANPDDEQIKTIIVQKYQDLVHSISRKFARDRMMQEDLYQVGMIGLLSAIRRFDPSFGKSFEAFAVPTIAGEIKRFIRDKTWSIHVPRKVKELGPKIKKAVDELTRSLERSPRIDEIANYLDVGEEDVLETMELGKSYNAISVDSKIEADSEGGTVTLLDLIGKKDIGYEKINEGLLLQKVLNILTERERAILKLTYFDNLSQKETGERLGISQMHVSRLQRRALVKLREALNNDGIEMMQ
ncbi:RNA polymerase sigma factor SigB [Pullulanibacillus sp. KACC 23026]|uniref:RNA polymerase sigma factor SigB n=1 Tax=Pullulanibacillus sp. KACC 23026 TaxID=3028315 RepID=UPI0023B12005|nr:RNA polymerase sigma factor SigB [Pullulanibacillus sp. KACC 23026]WEG12521.1 RNA polymerase sigma factor SigB [Pullulanibacillus sp. KACC 23026]